MSAIVVALVATSEGVCAEWGDLTMQFQVDAPRRQLPLIVIPANQRSLDSKITSVVDEEVVVAADGALANVVVYCRTAAVPIREDRKVRSLSTVEARDRRFQPRIAVVWVGKQTFEFVNHDETAHKFMMSPRGYCPVPCPLLAPSESFLYEFQRPSSIPCRTACDVDPLVCGYVVAKDHPYVGVSDAEGKLTIQDLPVGRDLEFQVWHEKTGYLQAVPAWVKGRFTLAPKPGLTDLGVVQVPAQLLK
jgi:hypothetical protein